MLSTLLPKSTYTNESAVLFCFLQTYAIRVCHVWYALHVLMSSLPGLYYRAYLWSHSIASNRLRLIKPQSGLLTRSEMSTTLIWFWSLLHSPVSVSSYGNAWPGLAAVAKWSHRDDLCIGYCGSPDITFINSRPCLICYPWVVFRTLTTFRPPRAMQCMQEKTSSGLGTVLCNALVTPTSNEAHSLTHHPCLTPMLDSKPTPSACESGIPQRSAWPWQTTYSCRGCTVWHHKMQCAFRKVAARDGLLFARCWALIIEIFPERVFNNIIWVQWVRLKSLQLGRFKSLVPEVAWRLSLGVKTKLS